MDPIFVTIGGEAIALPPIANFAQLERIWPAMVGLDATQDVVERTAARLAIISAALKETRPDLNVPELKKRLRVAQFDEMLGLIAPVEAFLVASGLIKKDAGDLNPGEAAPATISPEDTAAAPISST